MYCSFPNCDLDAKRKLDHQLECYRWLLNTTIKAVTACQCKNMNLYSILYILTTRQTSFLTSNNIQQFSICMRDKRKSL